MFRKIELWLVLLLLLLAGLGAVLFGAVVLRASRMTTPLDPLSETAVALAETPSTARDMIDGKNRLLAPAQAIFAGKPSGWSFPAGPLSGPAGYLLVSRYDTAEAQHVVELVSMPDMAVRYRWEADHEAMLGMIRHHSPFSETERNGAGYLREIHPWLMDDGSLVTKDHYSPAFRIDACGAPQWVIDGQAFHHSTEADADGNLWIASIAEKHTLPHLRYSFVEDQISKVSPDGRILYDKSVLQILMRHGYANWLFASEMYNDDPMHLNDIEPVLEDGPYWKKGDVFLSLRNVSAILLYRPSTDAIVWIKRGPWMSQHDVDILDDHRISVYGNQAQDRGTVQHNPYVPGHSRIFIYDFATGEVTAPYDAVMAANDIKTEAAGLFTALPDGSALIEDATDARLLVVRPDGRVGAEFVNRDADGEVSMLGWSRYVPKARGDAILARLQQVKCAA